MFRKMLLPHIDAVLQDCTTPVLGVAANLALVYYDAGHWKEAEVLEVLVMETTKRLLGEEHPDSLSSMANLAATYRKQGRWKEAEVLLVLVMETRKHLLDHSANTLNYKEIPVLEQEESEWEDCSD